MIAFTARRIKSDAMSSIALWSGPGIIFPLYCLEPGEDRKPHPIIPEGEYPLQLRTVGSVADGYAKHYARDEHFPSDWHRGVVEICNVPHRTAILFHVGNFIDDTMGCSLPGLHYGKDALGHYRVVNSRLAYEKAYPILRDAILGGPTLLRISDIGAIA